MPRSKKPAKVSVAQLYGDVGMSDAEFDAILDKSLNARGPEMFYAKLHQLSPPQTNDTILDIGCRDAHHSLELVKRFGSHVIAIDPVAFNMKKAKKLVSENKRTAKMIRLIQAEIEAIPLDDDSVDFIWCRDMLNHVPKLTIGLKECARVLKPNGKMLIFVSLATELLEPKEAAFLNNSLALVSYNMSKKNLENAMSRANLKIIECDQVGSEWREHGFEKDKEQAYTARQLLRLARMRRNCEQLIKKIGLVAYVSELADCYWGVYIMLGKLCPYVYTLQKKKS